MTSTDRRFGYNSEVAIKGPCVAATTANITLSGTQTIDGVAVVADDRVLVKDQTTASENGIYVVSANAWERAIDFDGNTEVKKGTLVYVHSGTANTGTFRVTTSDPITIGTSSIAFAASPLGATVSAFMATVVDDADSETAIETLYNDMTAETVTADDDVLFIRDTSVTAGRRITFSNFIARILTVARAFTADHTHSGAEAHSGIETHSNSEVFSGTPSINLTGGQIKFPATQSASADANTLDDYEEGTWTPSLTFAGGSTGMTYSTQTGTYTKIGRLVFCRGTIVLTAKGSSTGHARIEGLPFTPSTTTAALIAHMFDISFANQIHCVSSTSPDAIYLYETTDAGVRTTIVETNFANTSSMNFSATYEI